MISPDARRDAGSPPACAATLDSVARVTLCMELEPPLGDPASLNEWLRGSTPGLGRPGLTFFIIIWPRRQRSAARTRDRVRHVRDVADARLDPRVRAFAVGHRTGWLTAVLASTTWLGSNWLPVPILVAVTGYLLLRRGDRRAAVAVWVT